MNFELADDSTGTAREAATRVSVRQKGRGRRRRRRRSGRGGVEFFEAGEKVLLHANLLEVRVNLREWKAENVDHAGGVKQHFGLLCRRVLGPGFVVGSSEIVVNVEVAVGLGEVLVSDGCLEGAEEAWLGQEAPCGGEKASEIVYQVRLTEGISCVSVVV